MRCVQFLQKQALSSKESKEIRTISLYTCQGSYSTVIKCERQSPSPIVVAVVFPRNHFETAKTFWQHTGEGISSRRAEICYKLFKDGLLVTSPPSTSDPTDNLPEIYKGPQRYRKQSAGRVKVIGQGRKVQDTTDYVQFIEERFGRNLNAKLAAGAKLAIRRRIAGALIADVDLDDALKNTELVSQERGVRNSLEEDVYLYPSGMSAIFNTHRTMLQCRGPRKSICFGFVSSVTIS